MAYSYEPHYFEDFEVGQTFQSGGRTITETDLVNYAALGGDWTEVHTNAEYAATQPFGERVAHAPLTFTVALGLIYRCGFFERTVAAFLGMDTMTFPTPVFIDDTISIHCEVTECRNLDSRDDVGMLGMDTTMTDQNDETVMDGEMSFFVNRAYTESADLNADGTGD